MELAVTPIKTIVNAKNRKQIAVLTKGGRSEKELKKLATDLVNRYNTYAALVSALEEIGKCIDIPLTHYGGTCGVIAKETVLAIKQKIEQVIQQAKEVE